MPTTNEALDFHGLKNMVVAPSKAVTAGGVLYPLEFEPMNSRESPGQL